MEETKIINLIKEINKNPYDADNWTQEELEKVIEYAADKYYNTKSQVIEDPVYDILVDFLKTKYPKSKIIKKIGAKVKGKNKVKLDYWLGSMDKIKPGSKELEKWLNKYTSDYVLSDKLDGISALVIYRTDGTINMYTRGTASEGLDITPLVKYFKLPSLEKANIKASKKNILLAVRGELILDKETFDSRWSNTMKNARNAVSGLVNSKQINPKLAIDTQFIVYEIVDPILMPSEQLKISKKLGFDTVNYKTVNTISYESLSEYLKKRRTDSDFTIDGIIVTNNEIYERNIKSNPEYSFAFKDVLEDQMAETKVIEIEWNISKDGLIKPTLILEPVDIGGVTISRVTAHNAKFVVDNKLGKDAVIQLIRSGDVIPYVQKVIKSAKTIQMPTGEWSWNATKVDLVTGETDSKAMLIKNIYFFFSSLDTKGLGEKIVEKLVDAKIDTVKKILSATVYDLLSVEGFKEKSALNLVESIKKSTSNVKLSTFMAATNKLGAGIGEERVKMVLEKYPNLLKEYTKWTQKEFIENLKEINGWEEKTSSLFVSNFKEFIKFYKDIKEFIHFEEIKEKKITKNKYTDKTIVMSGFRDAELQKFLENSGAKITNSVSKNTNILIVKDEDTITEGTGKVKKALDLGVDIITKDSIKY
jgi:DNA ligase (NAD+)